MDPSLNLQRLTEVGFSRYEASAYLALLGHAESTAVEVADRADVPRQRIYDILKSLAEKGLVTIRDGRPVRHTARPPAMALPALLAARERQQAVENARLSRLIQEIVPDLEQRAGSNGTPGLLERILRASEETIGGF